MWIVVGFVVLLGMLALFAVMGYLRGRTVEMWKASDRGTMFANAIIECVRNFPKHCEGEMCYDHRGWVYVYIADDWKMIMVRDKALRFEELDENGKLYVKPFTVEEEEDLPYKKQYRASMEALKTKPPSLIPPLPTYTGETDETDKTSTRVDRETVSEE